MGANHDSAAGTAPLELTVSRLIDAPPALVFKAWTQQEHAARWWGPKGFTIISAQLDGTLGGSFRIAMRGADGTMYTKRGTYHEVTEPERLVFTYAWENAEGNLGHEMRITVTFKSQGDHTLLTLHQIGFENMPERDSHQSGWTSCFERFAEYMTTPTARQ
jgi:uncharacterized protein YndB with AHSA1/START domain